MTISKTVPIAYRFWWTNELFWGEQRIAGSGSMAKVRDGNAADLSQRINVAFYTGQINRCLCNYWRGLQRISEASPPEDVTVGQVQRVGHSRLDPDCTSTITGGAVIAWPRRCAH